MSHPLSFASVCALAVLAGCANNPRTASTAAAPAMAAGKTVCIPTYRIDHTEVLDDSTILFHMVDRSVWKNTLSFPCPDLKFEGGFQYATDIDQICSNLQTIRVVNQGGGPRFGAVCQLGTFTPYTPQPKPAGG